MAMQLHTRNLTDGESMVLDGTEGVLMMSYQMSGNTGDGGTLLGNLSFKAANDSTAQPSEAVIIPANGGNVFDNAANQKSMAFTITCTQGTLRVIIGF